MVDTAVARGGRIDRGWLTVGLCLLAAMVDGYDIQSGGLAGLGMKADLHLDPSQLGIVFSASTLGLLPGAAAGGRAADRIGRKWVLIASLALFGLASVASALSWSYASLILARFVTGVGLGAAIPSLIALTAEAAGPAFRHTAVAVMYAGMPAGGLIASVVSLVTAKTLGWHAIFYVGGLAPLVIAPLLWAFLPESRVFTERAGGASQEREPVLQVLFGAGRTAATLCLWAGYFFTLLVLFLLQNWLPSLIVAKGFSRETAFGVQMAFNVGGILGVLAVGWLMDRGRRRSIVAVVYLGLIAAMVLLAASGEVQGFTAGAFLGGLCSIGAQLILYALAPVYYHTLIRGTGVGAAVAIGRLGSVAGPVAAGLFLAGGGAGEAVLVATAPGILIALAVTQLLLGLPAAVD